MNINEYQNYLFFQAEYYSRLADKTNDKINRIMYRAFASAYRQAHFTLKYEVIKEENHEKA